MKGGGGGVEWRAGWRGGGGVRGGIVSSCGVRAVGQSAIAYET